MQYTVTVTLTAEEEVQAEKWLQARNESGNFGTVLQRIAEQATASIFEEFMTPEMEAQFAKLETERQLLAAMKRKTRTTVDARSR